ARPRTEAARAASRTLSALRGPEPHSAWREIASLQAPDPEQARLVLGCLAAVRHALVVRGAVTWPELGWHLEPRRIRRILSGGSVTKRQRIGFDRWEPFNAAVVAAEGRLARGVASAPGVGCGRMCWISRQRDMERFRPRDVVVAPHPTPDLAALLWDAAGVVTTGGSPAAHLFESARALAIPAVSGVHLDEVVGGNPAESQDLAMAVDGSAGTLFVTEW
ncbi:MAG: PEP-utilizing enzyme, partial [Actinomycetota bacterium]